MTAARATLPLSGLWKLTKCESSRPELPHPTAGTAEFTQHDDGIHYINHSEWSHGQITESRVVFHFDGNWYPVAGALMFDSMSGQHLPDGSFEIKMRKGEANFGGCRCRVSPDAKLLTADWELVLPGGVAVTWKTTSEQQKSQAG